VTNIRGVLVEVTKPRSVLWVEPPTLHGDHVASELIISPTLLYPYNFIA